jgi:ubiquinone/menaquinone biosynthesis C-methylase UbiE
MTTQERFQGPIPEVYERLFVPLIFEPYAEDLAGRIATFKPDNVLEIAAGTGVVTRAMAARLAPDIAIVATDLSPAMLDVAKSRQANDPRIAWQTADAMALPFPDERFDLVVCQFGAMFFPGKVGGYGEARRVLRPRGHFLFNVWDGLAANDFARAAHEALGAIFPESPPEFMARIPHGYFDEATIRAQLAEAGFSDIQFEAVAAESRAPTALQAATAYCQGTPMRPEIESRAPGALAEVTGRVAEVFAQRFGEGPVTGNIRAFVVQASRPG